MPTNNSENKKLVQAWFNLKTPADLETYTRWLKLLESGKGNGLSPKGVLEIMIHDAYIKYIDEDAPFPNAEADFRKLIMEAIDRLGKIQITPGASPQQATQEATNELDKLQKSIASRYQFDDDED